METYSNGVSIVGACTLRDGKRIRSEHSKAQNEYVGAGLGTKMNGARVCVSDMRKSQRRNARTSGFVSRVPKRKLELITHGGSVDEERFADLAQAENLRGTGKGFGCTAVLFNLTGFGAADAVSRASL